MGIYLSSQNWHNSNRQNTPFVHRCQRRSFPMGNSIPSHKPCNNNKSKPASKNWPRLTASNVAWIGGNFCLELRYGSGLCGHE